MSTAATTPALLPPNATSAVVSPSSTIPKPPGVIGIAPMMRTSDQAANISTRHLRGRHADGAEAEDEQQEDGQAAGERREREHVPASRQEIDRLVAEAREARPSPRPPGLRRILAFAHETNRATTSPTSCASSSE